LARQAYSNDGPNQHILLFGRELILVLLNPPASFCYSSFMLLEFIFT